MKTKYKYFISRKGHSFTVVSVVALFLQFAVLASFSQSDLYLFTGAETAITLNPGTYDITAYGAQGGRTSTLPGLSGGGAGLGAEMEGEFSFPTTVNLTLLVGGVGAGGGSEATTYWGAGGGGGSFVVEGSTPLLIAGGGGGGGTYDNGRPGLTGTSGGNDTRGGGTGGTNGYGGSNGGGYAGGGGGYSGGSGAGFGGGGRGGGSIIDSSAIMALAEVSGVASPDDSPNGEIIIIQVPEPPTLALAAMSVLPLLLFRRQRK